MTTLIDPKEITLFTRNGEERAYIISRFPAVAGREIMKQYEKSDPPANESDQKSMLLKTMSHVAVNVAGSDTPLRLSTEALVNSHVPDCITLGMLEKAVLRYNIAPSGNDEASTFRRVSISIGKIDIHTGGGEDYMATIDLEKEEDGDQPDKRILQ